MPKAGKAQPKEDSLAVGYRGNEQNDAHTENAVHRWKLSGADLPAIGEAKERAGRTFL